MGRRFVLRFSPRPQNTTRVSVKGRGKNTPLLLLDNKKPALRYEFLRSAAIVSRDYPVVISKYVENAKEVEFDGVACSGDVVNYAYGGSGTMW